MSDFEVLRELFKNRGITFSEKESANNSLPPDITLEVGHPGVDGFADMCVTFCFKPNGELGVVEIMETGFLEN